MSQQTVSQYTPADAHLLLSLRLRNAAIKCDQEQRPLMAELLTEAADVLKEYAMKGLQS